MDPRCQPLNLDCSAAGHQEHGASKPADLQITDAPSEPVHRDAQMMTDKKEKRDRDRLWFWVLFLRLVTYKINHLPPNAHSHTNTHTTQPSSMGMPLDMILACSNHASWNCGLLAFGLPSASNKLSQPDPSEVPFTLKAERKNEWARDREWETKKWEQGGMSETDKKRNRNKEQNESTSQTYYYPIHAASKATQIVLIAQWC